MTVLRHSICGLSLLVLATSTACTQADPQASPSTPGPPPVASPTVTSALQPQLQVFRYTMPASPGLLIGDGSLILKNVSKDDVTMSSATPVVEDTGKGDVQSVASRVIPLKENEGIDNASIIRGTAKQMTNKGLPLADAVIAPGGQFILYKAISVTQGHGHYSGVRIRYRVGQSKQEVEQLVPQDLSVCAVTNEKLPCSKSPA